MRILDPGRVDWNTLHAFWYTPFVKGEPVASLFSLEGVLPLVGSVSAL
jgi:hypothetical protein